LLLAGVGKFGLNLQCADLLIFATVPKSLFEYQQLVGRLVRIGQESVVSCELLYMSGTYEADLVKKVFG
jgi:superfamily II DNA or RNA helicase